MRGDVGLLQRAAASSCRVSGPERELFQTTELWSRGEMAATGAVTLLVLQVGCSHTCPVCAHLHLCPQRGKYPQTKLCSCAPEQLTCHHFLESSSSMRDKNINIKDSFISVVNCLRNELHQELSHEYKNYISSREPREKSSIYCVYERFS